MKAERIFSSLPFLVAQKANLSTSQAFKYLHSKAWILTDSGRSAIIPPASHAPHRRQHKHG